ncbi:MAG: hypothetical protein M3188_04120, partial [Actinomycetota bacterium]|nr:hypothetical protein [Actinomycetota bacterium]
MTASPRSARFLVAGAGLLAVGVSFWERRAPESRVESDDERAGEYYALLLAAVAGMTFFVAANNLMTLFLGLE